MHLQTSQSLQTLPVQNTSDLACVEWRTLKPACSNSWGLRWIVHQNRGLQEEERSLWNASGMGPRAHIWTLGPSWCRYLGRLQNRVGHRGWPVNILVWSHSISFCLLSTLRRPLCSQSHHLYGSLRRNGAKWPWTATSATQSQKISLLFSCHPKDLSQWQNVSRLLGDCLEEEESGQQAKPELKSWGTRTTQTGHPLTTFYFVKFRCPNTPSQLCSHDEQQTQKYKKKGVAMLQ